MTGGAVTGPRATDRPPLLEVRNLAEHYVDKWGVTVRAVDGVSFALGRGEVLGIVGESGCGKSTLGRTIMRLMQPTSGEVFLDGVDFASLSGRALKQARRHLQMVFQDPFGSLNPRHSVGGIIAEPLKVHRLSNPKSRVAELLELVGLPADSGSRYPHEFSGGQRQRIAIARALALSPKLIIADEPVSALDVSIQSQIINLVVELRARLGLSMIFISHDLSVVRHVADRVGVMYFGKIVELAPTPELFANPLHPYTQTLLAAVPKPVLEAIERSASRAVEERATGEGRQGGARPVRDSEVPDPANPPPGCAFHGRCPIAVDACLESVPPLVELSPGRQAACFRAVPPSRREQPSP